MRQRVKGYITVYLSLTLGLMIVFILTMLEGLRQQTIRFQTECVMDAGLNSIFAEYHREMLNQYDLLFIDDSYGSNNASTDNTKAHLLSYMNLNFKACEDKKLLGMKDITAINADNAVLKNVSMASDNSGEVLRYQIIQLQKARSGINLIDNNHSEIPDMEQLNNDYESYNSERDAANDSITAFEEEYNANLEEGEDPIEISNPADSVESLTPGGALLYAFDNVESISRSVYDINSCISHRNYSQGAGLYDNQESPYGLINDQLFYSYLFDKCGYYSEEKDKSVLKYQIEYILKGNNSDVANLQDVADDIFKIRYALNMAYLSTSLSKQAEAEEMALAATSAVGFPELAEIVKWSILFAWGYAESAKDIRILYDGHSLGAVKTDEDWNTPLSQMIDFKLHLSEYRIPLGSISYKDYLYGFILLESREDQNMRLMDVMEMDVRNTAGNGHFRMDSLIYQLIATVNVSSKYGYGYEITRMYSYE